MQFKSLCFKLFSLLNKLAHHLFEFSEVNLTVAVTVDFVYDLLPDLFIAFESFSEDGGDLLHVDGAATIPVKHFERDLDVL